MARPGENRRFALRLKTNRHVLDDNPSHRSESASAGGQVERGDFSRAHAAFAAWENTGSAHRIKNSLEKVTTKQMLKPTSDVILSGRFRPEQERQYTNVSFWLPEGTRQFHLKASYTHRISSDPTLG